MNSDIRPEAQQRSMRSAIRTWVVGRRHEIVLFIVMTLVAWIGLDFLLALAGVPFLLDLWEVNSISNAVAQGHIVAAATAWVGASLGLWTFFVNVWEKRRAHEEQLQKDREIAEEQRRADREALAAQLQKDREVAELQRLEEREALAAQLQKDREIAELQRLEERFNQLSDDFSQGGSESLLARVNAAIGLADLAVRPRPGLSEEDLAAKAADHPEEAYPFFRRAAMQLSAALYLYPEPEARAEVRKAIRAIAEFTHQRQPNLCPVLTNQVAHANRAAKSALLGVIAKDWSRRTGSADRAVMEQHREDYLNELAELLAPTEVTEVNREVVSDLLEEARTSGSDWQKRDAGSIDPERPLETILSAWNVVRETRNAIQDCMYPRKWKEEPTGYRLNIDPAKYSRNDAVLSDCFLVGANFFSRNLWATKLLLADLRGTRFSFADLDQADLESAKFSCVNAEMASLNGADFQNAVVIGSDLSFAEMRGATMTNTDLTRTKLSGTDLRFANLENATLLGTNWTDARIGHANLLGARLIGEHEGDGGQGQPQDWRQACFARKDPESAEEERLAEQTWQQMLRLWLPEGEEPPPRPDIAYDVWQAQWERFLSEFLEAEGQAS